jgi:hypothetical protein
MCRGGAYHLPWAGMVGVENENPPCVSSTRVMPTPKESRFAGGGCSERSVNRRETELCTAPANDQNWRSPLLVDSKEGADEDCNGADMPDYDCRVCDKGPEDIGAWARVAVEMGGRLGGRCSCQSLQVLIRQHDQYRCS